MTLTEEFDDSLGRFINYKSSVPAADTAYRNLSHVNIRSFYYTPYDLWNVNITPTTNGFKQIQAAISANSRSFIKNTLTSKSGQSDISGFLGTGSILITLPGFVPGSVNLASSNFYIIDQAGLKRSWAFNTGTGNLSNGELKLPLSVISNDLINYSAIEEIGFDITSTAATTFRCTSIRALSPLWTYTPQDIDTRGQALRRTVPPTGDLTLAASFAMPILWHSGNPIDPAPSDAEFTFSFNTGAATNRNNMVAAFREFYLSSQTQSILNSATMSSLDAGTQPDYGTSAVDEAVQFTLAWGGTTGVTATRLLVTSGTVGGGSTVFTIDTPSNLLPNTNYVWFVGIEENTVTSSIYKVDSTGKVSTLFYDAGSVFDSSLIIRRKGRLGWSANLVDGDSSIASIRQRKVNYAEYRSASLRSITPVEGCRLFAQNSPPIDLFGFFVPGTTGPIRDFIRQVDLDPLTQAGVESISGQPEYKAPIAGVSSLSVIDLSRDSIRSTTGLSWKVKNPGSDVYLGINSNLFEISDFENTEIELDIYYQDDPVNIPIEFSIANEFRTFSYKLVTPKIVPNQWQKVRLLLPFGKTALTGNYRLAINQPLQKPSTYWIDRISILSRTVVWDARAETTDPWSTSKLDWIPFRNTTNTDSGILFNERGFNLQVRGRALTPSATISNIQIKPKYSELGNFNTFTTNRYNLNVRMIDLDPHTQQDLDALTMAGLQTLRVETYSFNYTKVGSLTYRFTNQTTLNGSIINSEWSFGDGGTQYGRSVDHLFPAAGTYSVILVTTTEAGKQTSTQQNVTVS
jgi:hypothetical protein